MFDLKSSNSLLSFKEYFPSSVLACIYATYTEVAVNLGYSEFNLIRASAVLNCQSTFAALVLRSVSYADNSLRR